MSNRTKIETLELNRRSDQICDQFESCWNSSQPLSIEDCLARLPEARSFLLFELVKLDVELHRTSGKHALLEEYLSRFPGEICVRKAFLAAAPIGNEENKSRSLLLDSATEKQYRSSQGKIDRYEIERILGEGGFGTVYLAFDPHLSRHVAIKVPRAGRVVDQLVWNQFVSEASAVSRLKHDAIIPVFDIGKDEVGTPFVVMEYVKGTTLNEQNVGDELPVELGLQFIRGIAEGLEYAHRNSIVHRDLKPANIMIEEGGRIRIADFGLAIHENISIDSWMVHRAGTLAFMSPEQLRGENHLLDSRTDIWALGVIVYWLFTGSYPFKSTNMEELYLEIIHHEPPSIRQLRAEVPGGLDQLCKKCLAKLMPDRYATVQHLLDDLQYLENQLKIASGSTSSANLNDSSQHLTIVPKGLRSFDSSDQEFFLSLLPGPTDRLGVPESIRFWIQRLSDLDSKCRIGLIYGQSGCGKTSFVKAGLLPRLPTEFKCIYLECNPDSMEKELTGRLVPHLDAEHQGKSLKEIVRGIRLQSTTGKHACRLLIVLDQFEQWLDACKDISKAELVEALRQCDGERIQCLILVRDDFWMRTQEFFQHLNEKIQDGRNSMPLPLLGPRHARKVLEAFGRAYLALPLEGSLDPIQTSNVHYAIDRLAVDSKVISAHLALFVEMMKDRDWGSKDFSEMCEWETIGMQFLEEQFAGESTSLARRQLLPAVKEILSSLVPRGGSNIKTSARTVEEMFAAQPPEKADAALRLLVDETRILTKAVEPSNSSGNSQNMPIARYRLTHDVLVEPVRTWLTQKQRETRTGRAELCLAEVADLWNAKPENKRLPSLLEYLDILLWTSRSRDRNSERKLLYSASRYYVGRAAIVAFIGVYLIYAFANYRTHSFEQSIQQAATLIGAIQHADPSAVPSQMVQLRAFSHLVPPLLNSIEPIDDTSKLRHLFLRCHFLSNVTIDELLQAVELQSQNECQNVVEAIQVITRQKSGTDSVGWIQRKMVDRETDDRFKIRLAILAMHLDEPKMLLDCMKDLNLRTVFVHELPNWHCDLQDCIHAADGESVSIALCSAFSLLAPKSLVPSQSKVVREWLESQMQTTTPGLAVAARHAIQKLIPNDSLLRLPSISGVMSFAVGPDKQHLLEFVKIRAGKVPLEEGVVRDDTIGRDPVVSSDFYMAMHEVKADLFFQFIDAQDTSGQLKVEFARHVLREHPGGGFPIYNVTRHAAAQFCNWLSKELHMQPVYRFNGLEKSFADWVPIPENHGFRLPKAIEWELACRAGSKRAFFFGDQKLVQYVNSYAWMRVDPALRTHPFVGPVGVKLPNEFGVFDTLGNVSEWMHDYMKDYGEKTSWYAIRGGNLKDTTDSFRSGYFIQEKPGDLSQFSGIRLVLPLNEGP